MVGRPQINKWGQSCIRICIGKELLQRERRCTTACTELRSCQSHLLCSFLKRSFLLRFRRFSGRCLLDRLLHQVAPRAPGRRLPRISHSTRSVAASCSQRRGRARPWWLFRRRVRDAILWGRGHRFGRTSCQPGSNAKQTLGHSDRGQRTRVRQKAPTARNFLELVTLCGPARCRHHRTCRTARKIKVTG